MPKSKLRNNRKKAFYQTVETSKAVLLPPAIKKDGTVMRKEMLISRPLYKGIYHMP